MSAIVLLIEAYCCLSKRIAFVLALYSYIDNFFIYKSFVLLEIPGRVESMYNIFTFGTENARKVEVGYVGFGGFLWGICWLWWGGTIFA